MDNFNEKGALLKKAREAKGISLESVQEQTKIPLDSLRAIEEGYTIRTLSPFYQKGFIKIYAQYLEYDVNAALSDFNPKAVSSASPLPKKSSLDSSKPFPVQLKADYRQPNYSKPAAGGNSSQDLSDDARVIPQRKRFLNAVGDANVGVHKRNFNADALAALSVKKKSFQTFLTPDRVRLILKIIGLAFAVFIFFKTIGFIGGKLTSKEKKSSPSKVTAMKPSMKAKKEKVSKDNRSVSLKQEETKIQPALVATEIRVNPKIEIPVASVVPDQVAPPVQGVFKNVMLSVRAKRNSWLQVKVDGATVFAAVLKRGVSETWDAQAEIEISGKNLNQLEFEVNGKMIGVLGRGESHAKTVVVTKNGLSIKK